MREITTHRPSVDSLDAKLTIRAADGPGPGGANHRYEIRIDEAYFPADVPPDGSGTRSQYAGQDLRFQHYSVKEAGVNGISVESLLAVCGDRLEGFQRGPFPCEENAAALHHIQAAMEALHRRTVNRFHRGVEGRTTA